ncbi:MAG TPA: hypothetical protein PKW35_04700 [Nannocystaceae bacterium]|nr:hypothetical protein [Nannocystaceae bacterium]
MTPFHFDTIESSARLVAFGLTPGLKPAREPAYAQLIERYRTDSAMRHCTDAVARGLHLAVLGFTPQGIVLGADEDGPFVHRLTDYRRTTLSVEDRMCHGLVQLAIAAWCFPTAQDLAASDDSAGVRFSTNKVVAYVVRLSEELQRRSQHDPELGSPELREAWRAILQRPETRATPDGRRTANTLHGMIDYALEVLDKGSLVRRLNDDDGGTWQALAAYRIHVRELAAHDAFNLVQSVRPARDAAAQE